MNDIINGIFEIVGGLLLVINIVKLVKDKTLAGVSIWPTLHFTVWGAWNLWYYPSLGQTWSFWGAVMVVSANTVWVVLAVVYAIREKKKTATSSECKWSGELKVTYADGSETYTICSYPEKCPKISQEDIARWLRGQQNPKLSPDALARLLADVEKVGTTFAERNKQELIDRAAELGKEEVSN